MDVSEILKASIIEELNGAENEYNLSRYKNALILYSKAVFSLCDYIVALKKLKLPKDHSERFRILERHIPKLYPIVDRLFKIYTDTYLEQSDKESCGGMKNAIKEINGIEKLDREIKAIIEKI